MFKPDQHVDVRRSAPMIELSGHLFEINISLSYLLTQVIKSADSIVDFPILES